MCLAIGCMQVLSLVSIHGQTAPLAAWSIVLWRARRITSLFVCCTHSNPQRWGHTHACFVRFYCVKCVGTLMHSRPETKGFFFFFCNVVHLGTAKNTSRALYYMLFWLISALTVLLCNISCLDRLYIGCCVITLLTKAWGTSTAFMRNYFWLCGS